MLVVPPIEDWGWWILFLDPKKIEKSDGIARFMLILSNLESRCLNQFGKNLGLDFLDVKRQKRSTITYLIHVQNISDLYWLVVT